MFVLRPLAALICGVVVALGQQVPFISINGPNAPKSASFLYIDKIRGGLWLGGAVKGAEHLTYFDGSRFISPSNERFPGMLVTAGMAEDRAGGIWLTSSTGLYRLFRGHWEHYTSNPVTTLVEAAPNVLLMAATRNVGQAPMTDLIRVAQRNGRWTVETLVSPFPSTWVKLNRDGKILFPCPNGYCEIRGIDVAEWHSGQSLRITSHNVPGTRLLGSSYGVLRDRFGCVWLKSEKLMYQCPGDPQIHALNKELIGTGWGVMRELEDGSIVVTSFDRLAIVRPERIRLLTARNGFPGTLSVIATKDGTMWMSNGNGLFAFPRHLPMEFWTERDGLAGSTWGIQRTSKGATFGIAGRKLEVLDRDRGQWSVLPLRRPIDHIVVGRNNSILAGTLSTDMLRISSEGKILGKASVPAEEMGNGIVSGPTGSWTCSERGLFRQVGGEWHSFLIDGQPLGGACRDLAIDWNGNIWFDRQEPQDDFGVVQDPNGNHPRIVTFKKGDDIVRFLGVDKRGWIWRGSPFGVYVADFKEALHGEWLYLNHLDGIAGADANRRSFFSDSDGSVWFGADFSIDHLFPPDDLVHPNYAPDVFVSAFSTNGGAPVMADMVGEIRSNANLVAHVGSLQFDRRNALRLRYRLLPQKPEWRETKELDLSLGRLAPGVNTLEVQARLFTGPWSPTVRQSLTIRAPLWHSWWILTAFAALLTSVAGGGFYQTRQRMARARRPLPDLASWQEAALAPELHELAGAVLDSRYEVGRFIARGGFATVLQGRDLANEGQRCAIKVFHRELLDKGSARRKFEQEIAALETIHHPNIVHIDRHGVTPDGTPYLVMEFIEGQTLRQVLDSGPISVQQTASYLRQMGSALSAIHACGIFHRDLKPENIMIRANAPAREALVLIDFSIAIIKKPNQSLLGLSRAAGTVDYMAPEHSIGYADASTDVYNLAKLALEMLTGRRLSSLVTVASLDLPSRVHKLIAELDIRLNPESVNLISSALEFDPTRRLRDALAFADRIASDLESGQT